MASFKAAKSDKIPQLTTHQQPTSMSHPSGNIMAISSKVSHQTYGSSRLGEYRGGRKAGQLTTGRKSYELSNHLGNVLATISDAKVAVEESGSFSHFAPEVVSATDYYPFGLAMEERTFSSEGYRWGFNGKEDDTQFGSGIQDYGMRMYKRKIARFISEDPLTAKYPELTPYQFASNTPMQAIDLDGLEAFFIHGTLHGPEQAWANQDLVDALFSLTNNKTKDVTFRWNYKAKSHHKYRMNYQYNQMID